MQAEWMRSGILTWFGYLLPYEGNVDWNAFMRALNSTAFDGAFMLEACYPFDFEAADQSSDVLYTPPPLPPKEYLAEAMHACARALNQTQQGA